MIIFFKTGDKIGPISVNKTLRKFLRSLAITLAILFASVFFGIAGIYFITEERINRTYDFWVEAIEVPRNRAAVERGLHLTTTSTFCIECHGRNFSGQTFDEGRLIGRVTVSNLTTGNGGIGRVYTTWDYVRAIRHGVGRDGKTLIGMPSHTYYFLSDEDLAAIIAYLKTLPPFDNELPRSRIGPLLRILLLRDPSILPAQVIDHTGQRPPAPEPGISLEYGEYLANMCEFCHGHNLAGGGQEGPGLNLTPGGPLASWTAQDFIKALRTGIKPDGTEMNPEMMPWRSVGQMTDDELKAVWIYLQSLTPTRTASN